MTNSKTGPILVINPNSSVKVTEDIARSVAPLRLQGGPAFECVGIDKGPATISSMKDSAEAALNVAEIVQARPDASAYIIACFSDPGVDLCRTLVRQPVIGIQEAGILTAMAQADLFGIVALGPASVAPAPSAHPANGRRGAFGRRAALGQRVRRSCGSMR